MLPVSITTGLAVPQWKIPELSLSSLLYWARLSEYRHKIILGILGAAALYVLIKTLWDLAKIFRKKKSDQEKKDHKQRVGFIISRFGFLGMLLFVLTRSYDPLWLYLHRFSIAILLVWLIIAAIATWILGRFARWGTISILTIHHVALLGLTAGFLFHFPLYRFDILLFTGQLILVNVAILVREQSRRWIVASKVFWLMAAVFSAFVFAPIFTHPSVSVANNPPRFGTAAIVQETEGMAVLQAKVSEKGTMLYFITNDKDRGLARLDLNSRKIEYDQNGMKNFSVLERFEGEDILAVGAMRANTAQIAVYSMDPYLPIGYYNMPTAAVSSSRIESMTTTPKRTYATVSSPVGSFLLVCPSTVHSDLENPRFKIRCLKIPIENATPGYVAASDFLNRLILGLSVEPFDVCYSMKEWLSLTLKQRQDIKVGRGATDMKYGHNKFRLYIGRPFSDGIEVAETDSYKIIGKIPGPFCITTLYAGERIVAGGSYLEGEVLIYDLQTGRSETVRVGPKITDIDYNEKLNDIFVATGNGVFQIDLDLLFDNASKGGS